MDYLQTLKYHYRPKKGWINDPNGLVFYDGSYHLFCQHCPDTEKPEQAIVWGHARTKNFIDWEELPDAILPDCSYDSAGCWSGTAIEKDGILYLIYTSIVRNDENPSKPHQTISVAYSSDGISFTKYENNPVILPAPSDGSKDDFRDPAVAFIDGTYYCVIASGHNETQTARLLLYKSSDIFNWEYIGVMAEWQDSRFAECPSFAKCGDKYLLTASVLTNKSGHFFSLMIGIFENGTFTAEYTERNYKGPDQYAGQMFLDDKGRNILISWIPGWDYIGFAEKDIGCMSLPCEIKLDDGKIKVYPISEVRHLLADSDEAVKITDFGFVIERIGRTAVEYHGEIRDLKIARDGYVVEVFVNGGEEVYTGVL